MIHEIKSSDWPAFCRRLTQERGGATANLETIELSGVKTVRAVGAIFGSMVFDKSDACNDVITLRLGGTREIVHEILEPIRITLQTVGESTDFNRLQIAAENGVAVITLHPGIRAQVLGVLEIN